MSKKLIVAALMSLGAISTPASAASHFYATGDTITFEPLTGTNMYDLTLFVGTLTPGTNVIENWDKVFDLPGRGTPTSVTGIGGMTPNVAQDTFSVTQGEEIFFLLRASWKGNEYYVSNVPERNTELEHLLYRGYKIPAGYDYVKTAWATDGDYVKVSFEDGGDYFNPTGSDFNDINFVLHGVSSTPVPSIPEPETYAMLLAGLGIVGAAARRARKNK